MPLLFLTFAFSMSTPAKPTSAASASASPAPSTKGISAPADAASLGAHDSPNLHKYTTGGAFYQWHLKQFMHRLYEMLAKTTPQTVLDAGCGEGFVTRFLRRQNADWNLTGVDVSAKAIAYARHHSNGDLRYATGDLYELPFEDDAFDTVVCSEVLEHLDDPDRALSEVHRVARRAVVLSVPREPYFRWLNDVGQALGLSPDPGHVNFWTEQGFQRFVRQHLHRPRFATKHIYQLACGQAA